MREKKDRVDDALHATKAAIEEGILPGGGVALLNASRILDSTKRGHDIVKKACTKPFEQILINAGWEEKDAAAKGSYELSPEEKWSGVDVENGNIINFKENGIIDPTKVTRLALENASSIAGTVLLTECTITQDKQSMEEKMRNLQSMQTGQVGDQSQTY